MKNLLLNTRCEQYAAIVQILKGLLIIIIIVTIIIITIKSFIFKKI